MKKQILSISLISVCLALSACGNKISQEKYDSVIEQKNELETENSELQNELDSLQTENATLSNEKEELEAQNQSLQNEYDEYKEMMKEYEGLQKAEAEAREIEANKKEEEEKVGYETGISYEQLARTPDDYVGSKVKFKGEVVQVLEGDDYVQIRLAVDSNYDNILFCEYDNSIVSSRVLENDNITIYGVSYGLYTYESTLGSNITIPCVLIDKIEQ